MPTFVGEPPGVPRRIWGRRRPSRLDPSHPIIGRNKREDIAWVDFAQSSPTFHRATLAPGGGEGARMTGEGVVTRAQRNSGNPLSDGVLLRFS